MQTVCLSRSGVGGRILGADEVAVPESSEACGSCRHIGSPLRRSGVYVWLTVDTESGFWIPDTGYWTHWFWTWYRNRLQQPQPGRGCPVASAVGEGFAYTYCCDLMANWY